MKVFPSLAAFLLAMTAIAVGQSNPVPAINQPLSPDSAAPGGAGFVLTIRGAGFVSGAVVTWNGGSRPTRFMSSTRIAAKISFADIATAGTASVTVVNPAPGGGASNVAFFEIGATTTAPAFTRSTAAAGQEPFDVATGDFNGDGNLDLAVPNVSGSNTSVLLGKGDGTFQAQVQYPSNAQPLAATVGDFNGDGKLDIAIANDASSKPSRVTILLGNGDGTFQSPQSTRTDVGPIAVAAGDFNRDGKLDVALAIYNDSFGSTLDVLLGNGDGTFQPAVAYNTGIAPESIVIADFNHDGILDLATANEVSSTVSVLLGNGDGTFQGQMEFPTGAEPIALAVADLNGDGRPDIATANLNGGNSSVLLGNGDGTFQPHVDYATAAGPVSVAIGDFNNDNKQDLLVVNDGAGTVSLLVGNGDGTFQTHKDFSGGSAPQGVTLGDFNKDGMLDVAVVNVFSNTVSVLLQNSASASAPLP